ncbi:hypothetical protein AVEN_76606-1 [Araneus ventricosus]|uniref:Uncharacterized protein n=1 Tax=Araneus ventricosus TaxID=182803 RepID=A0A4Y2KE12_ARAVE|nr:hypothetical protein AVEN_76606-1 [Araneus ventricosus]
MHLRSRFHLAPKYKVTLPPLRNFMGIWLTFVVRLVFRMVCCFMEKQPRMDILRKDLGGKPGKTPSVSPGSNSLLQGTSVYQLLNNAG